MQIPRTLVNSLPAAWNSPKTPPPAALAGAVQPAYLGLSSAALASLARPEGKSETDQGPVPLPPPAPRNPSPRPAAEPVGQKGEPGHVRVFKSNSSSGQYGSVSWNNNQGTLTILENDRGNFIVQGGGADSVESSEPSNSSFGTSRRLEGHGDNLLLFQDCSGTITVNGVRYPTH